MCLPWLEVRSLHIFTPPPDTPPPTISHGQVVVAGGGAPGWGHVSNNVLTQSLFDGVALTVQREEPHG